MAEHDDNLDLEAILSEHATIALFIGPDDRHHCVCDEPFGPEIIRMMPPKVTVEGWHREHVAQVIRASLLSALDAERAKNTEALALHHGPQLSDFNTGEFCSCGDRWPCKHRRILLGGKD